MALNSPGVQVTIVDQSQYLPAASNSVPLVLLATANNKADSTGTTIAPGSLASNANKLYLISSQRDLINIYGSPFFYKTSNSTPIHGYELNEYGLLATYSLLGVTNQCWVLRANIDLASLVGKIVRPAGAPIDGTYWLDTINSTWGIFELNTATNKFDPVTPLVLVDSINIIANTPKNSIGNVGDYAVIPIQPTRGQLSTGTYFYKTSHNVWVEVGTSDWKASHPVVTGTKNPALLTAGDEFTIDVNGKNQTYKLTITVRSYPNNNVADIVSLINNYPGNPSDVYAVNENNVISLYYTEYGFGNYITLTQTRGSSLDDMGLAQGNYYAPDVAYGTSAQMPLWSSSQSAPRPSGSVWIKTSAAGSGMNLVLSKYNATNAAFKQVNVPVYPNELEATVVLDPTGGQAIPADTVFAMVGTGNPESGVIMYRRLVTGPTVVTSSITSYNSITQGSKLTVGVSLPNTNAGSASYTITMSGTTASTFVTDWAAAQIPNTTATITTDGAIQLTHTLGGDIYLSDISPDPADNGQSNGLIAQLGFGQGTLGSRYSFLNTYTAYGVAASLQNGSLVTGTATFDIQNNKGHYIIKQAINTGQNYSVGDTLTFYGNLLGGRTPAHDLVITVTAVGVNGVITAVAAVSGEANPIYWTALSNWVELSYIPNEGAPTSNPADGTYWFYSTDTEVDIMVKKGTQWVAYGHASYDKYGHPKGTNGTNTTDPLGVIIQPDTPTTQTTGNPLVYGDLWLNTGDLENYPNLSRWQNVSGVDQWVAIDNTDQTSSNGILFADARWGVTSIIDPVNDPIPSITSMLKNDYLDLDAPDPAMYPQGMLLFNTRRSGFNVKQFKTNYFTAANYPDKSLPSHSYTWVTTSGLKEDGSAYMGRKAQRHMVVQAMKSSIATNMTIREEENFFNLIAAPNYPELQPDMVELNNERNNTAYIIGDTPLRLPDQATALVNWANNAANATSSGEDGWVTRDEYLGVFYPSGITSDLSGADCVVPASHMMLRTFLQNDTVAYPWFAAAGTRRGIIDNATNIGYLSGVTGEFQVIKNRMSIRDVLYENQINPLAFFTGIGLLNYGNKSSMATTSAMDRTNVGRLIAYIRYQLQIAARPFVFEPNDALTRTQITGVVQSLFIDLVAKRGLYDYLVVCDSTNNTPARIDRNELWIDIAIEPVKSTEFIYIPVRILNTGGIAALK